MLEVNRLSKSFGRLAVTSDVSLRVEDGERHIIIGPNGAGKTTLINQIGGQLRPDGGHIRLDGADITHLPSHARARAGLARTFQRNTLFARLSVFENIRLGVQARRGRPFDLITPVARRTDINLRTEQLIEQMQLARIARTDIARLSYGDLRQVEVAVALSTDATLLMLDEPTSGLSPSETADMIGIIQALPRSIGILMIEHDMDVVFSVADRITVLHYGEIIASGAPRDVAADARVQDVYLGAIH